MDRRWRQQREQRADLAAARCERLTRHATTLRCTLFCAAYKQAYAKDQLFPYALPAYSAHLQHRLLPPCCTAAIGATHIMRTAHETPYNNLARGPRADGFAP